MPIYEYRCGACGHHLEALQKMTDSPLRKCPDCGKSQLRRLVSASRFRLKGSGWYETDFKKDKEKKRNLLETAGAESSETAGDKSSDAPAKEDAGKSAAAAKGDGDAPPKGGLPKKVSTKSPGAKPTSRGKSAAKPRARAAQG